MSYHTHLGPVIRNRLPALLLLGMLLPMEAFAQGLSDRLLLRVDAKESGPEKILLLHFACPTQVLEHAPVRQGDSLLLLLRPAPECGSGDEKGALRLHAAIPPSARDWISDIQLDRSPDRDAKLHLRFRHTIHFSLHTSRDARTIRISLFPSNADNSSPCSEKRQSP